MLAIKSLYQASNSPRWQQWLIELPNQWLIWQQSAQGAFFMEGWLLVQQFPRLLPTARELQNSVTVHGQLLDKTVSERSVTLSPPESPGPWQHQLAALLQQLKPWRKGPFNLYGILIDSEWRSDWKWQRLLPHITPLKDRLVLDVGCANGYYLWRMVGMGARCALGIDPMGRFLAQFTAVQQLLGGDLPAVQLPYPLEQLPPLATFDSLFSMGVLYHRRDPLEHLQQLKQQLRPGGELVLETLILPDERSPILIPKQRYAQMRNVYAIPSVATLFSWLHRAGFNKPRLVDRTVTTSDEQRCTDWSSQNSLHHGLHPQDPQKTIEGYPAPLRAIVVANTPE
jgi:tRNA (mo5U34)-methyltransferase